MKKSYFEIFKVRRYNILGLSNQISILYLPLDNNNDQYDKSRLLGFRYYEKNNKEKCNHFTLINRYNKRYYILEKTQ